MGIAERFKQTIKKKNIFEKSVEKELEKNDIKFISKPVREENKTEIEDIPPIIQSDVSSTSFTIFENEIMNKIAKTPYWDEFSNVKKEKMISAYIEKRADKSYSLDEKNELIKKIIINTTK